MVSTFWNIPGMLSSSVFEFLERSLKPIGIYSDRGCPLYVSQSFLELLPTVAEEVDFFQYFASETLSHASLMQLWQQALEGKRLEFVAEPEDAQEPLQCSLQFNSEANLMFLIVEKTHSEEAHRHLLEAYERAVAALVRTEEKWQSLLLESLYLFLQVSSSGQIVDVSPAVEVVLNYQKEELLGRPIEELIHPNDVDAFQQLLDRGNRGLSQSEIECWWKSGSGKWVCLLIRGRKCSPNLEMDGIFISGYNVTDRKYLEAKLKASKDRLKSLMIPIPGAAFRCDFSYTMQFVSDGMESVTGYPVATFIDNQWLSYLSIVYPDDLKKVQDSLQRAALEPDCPSIEYRIVHADGSIRWVLDRKRGVFDPQGKLLWLDGVLLDVTEQKQTQVELSQSKTVNQILNQIIPGMAQLSDRPCLASFRLLCSDSCRNVLRC